MKVAAGGVLRQSPQQRRQVVQTLSNQMAHLTTADPPRSGRRPLGGQRSMRSSGAWGHDLAATGLLQSGQ